MNVREGEVQAAVIAYLNRAGYFCMSDKRNRAAVAPAGCAGVYWRQNTGGMRTATGFVLFGVKGCPDLLILPQARPLLGCECKRPVGGVQSDDQKWFAACLRAAGAEYVLENSVGFETLSAALPPVAVKMSRPSGRIYPR